MSLSKKSIIYLISNISNAAIPFLLLPILTRMLSPAEYGQVVMFQTLIAGLAGFIGLNSIAAASRKYYDSDMEQLELAKYNGACIQIFIVSFCFLWLLLLLFKSKFEHYFSIPADWVAIAIVVGSLNFMLQMRLVQWQVRGMAIKFGLLQVSNSFLIMILSLLFVVELEYGAQGRINAQLIAQLIIAFVALYLLVKDNLIYFSVWNGSYIKDALKFGVPLIPHIFAMFLLSSVDRFFISSSMGMDTAGIYMAVIQISMVFTLLFDALNKAYIPFLFNLLSENRRCKKYKVVKYTYVYFLFLILIIPVPFFIGPWLIKLVAGESYDVSPMLVGFICIGQVFSGMYLMVTNYIFYAKKTIALSIITVSTAVVHIILLLCLIPTLGVQGAAFAFALSMFIRFVITWFKAAKSVSMPWLIFRYKV